ncbi:MAG: thioredoxin family protein [Rhodovibrionaceae bacterium]|nr:thioredoxin family protein [Rhodovibrionaceae bacterium]
MAVSPDVCDFGWKAENFELEGTDGKTHRLQDLRGSSGTLVMFICNHCPYVRAVIDRIVRDTRELREHGVESVAIMPNDTEAYPEDGFERMKAFAREHDFAFPYLIDRTQEVARAYGAVCTPDFFGFNADLELQYRGRLDESRREAVPDAPRELFDAMVQVARTGEGPREQIPSMGCSIKWRGSAA